MQPEHTTKGYSLVEVIVAMGLMAVGMMAIMAMQFSALAGYVSARDQTNAAEIARAIDNTLKIEAQQWNSGEDLSWNPGGGDPNTHIAAFGGTTPFVDDVSLLSLVTAVPNWTWRQVIDEPVDQRMIRDGARRYCAFIKGGPMFTDPGAPEILQVQIAVVYPAGNRGLPGVDAATPFGKCDEEEFELDDLDPANPNAFEVSGYRAAYFGTQISPRQ